MLRFSRERDSNQEVNGIRPELSVITVTPEGLSAIDQALVALRSQTAIKRIELVVVAQQELPNDAANLEGFAATRLVNIGRIESLGPAIAAGFRAAAAPLVAYAEEHSYPEPGWAAALIERHREPWAAVGWSLESANPESTIGWAHLLANFGPAVAPASSGERRMLPWHHVSYKRAPVVACGDDLGKMLETEGMLHEHLLARGRRLYLEGTVASRHLNVSRLHSFLSSHFHGGRGFGSARARFETWSPTRRLAYALGFPLVPVLRLRRLLPDIQRTTTAGGPRRRLIPLIALGLTVDALGEAVGYLWGQGHSPERRLPIDLERARHVGRRPRG
jgi:hypothetical protein